jgi:hypothetical protein
VPYMDSAEVTATLTLLGAWLHDPLDAEGTAVNYLYGGATRDTSIDAAGAGTLYAGRAYPVMDYGEHEEQTVGVTIHVPFGATHASEIDDLIAWARAKRTLWLRDGRGRTLAGTMSAFKVADAKWGSAVTFTFGRVDAAVTEVSV